MDLKNITRMHTELLGGVCIEELSNAALLTYGNMLLKQYRQAKSVLRKLEDSQAKEAAEWAVIREHGYHEIDTVLNELNQRMIVDIEDFGEKMLLKMIDLVAAIRVAMFDEQRLDNAEVDEQDEVELIFSID